jgi:flagellar assembly factor FliW
MPVRFRVFITIKEGLGAIMLVKTKLFGEIELSDDKIITFPNGIMGFVDYKKYTLLYDINDDKEKFSISWLQSLDEANFALPVVNPYYVKPDYNPVVEDEILKSLGEANDENLLILLSLTVPSDITKMTANLKAPFIINYETKKGIQIIVENQDYEIKYNIYDYIQLLNNEKGDTLC